MHHLSLYIHHKRLYKLDNEKLEFFFKEKQDKEKKNIKKDTVVQVHITFKKQLYDWRAGSVLCNSRS